ncbi:hypothetical protein RK21_03491 [Pseudomonas plecoglossicida]|nr:hypothetical protein RK21_03491 [Pseudomonas plecoglossicida]
MAGRFSCTGLFAGKPAPTVPTTLRPYEVPVGAASAAKGPAQALNQ